MVTWTCRLLVICLVSLTASVSLAAQQTFDKRFTAPPGGHLTLDTDVGSVAIVGSDTREVVIHAQMSDSDHLTITAEQNSTGVTVTGRVTRNWFGWFNFSATRVRFTIDVPRDYPVEIETSGGDMDVRNLNASIEGKTSGGSINAERINGPVELGTSGGSIDIDDSTGDLNVHTSGGAIELKSLDGKVRAITSGGSVHAEVHTNRGVFLGTSGGAITLLLPENVHASIEAQTSGGRAQSDLALSTTDIADHSYLRGTLNGGGEPITLRTSGGSIHVEALK